MRSLSGASLAAVALLTLGSFTAGCGQVNVIKARKAFKAANQSYQAQDYKKAAEAYEEAIAADPENKDIQVGLGLAQLVTGDVQVAAATWLPVIEACSDPQILLDMVKLYHHTGDRGAEQRAMTRLRQVGGMR